MNAKSGRATRQHDLAKLPKVKAKADVDEEGPDPLRGSMPREPEVAAAAASLGTR